MFFSDNGVKCNVTCTLKVHTQGKECYETTTKILKKIKGVSYTLDAQEGNLIHISGKLDPQKFLKMIEKHGNKVEIIWMKTEQYGIGNSYVTHGTFCPPIPTLQYQYHNSAPLPYHSYYW